MRLPNAESAVVEDRKITEYLLCKSHEDGRGKANFFMQFGFTHDTLRRALLDLVQNNEVLALQSSDFGAKYVVEGRLAAPDGRSPHVRTIWIIDTGRTTPRLVTAFPA